MEYCGNASDIILSRGFQRIFLCWNCRILSGLIAYSPRPYRLCSAAVLKICKTWRTDFFNMNIYFKSFIPIWESADFIWVQQYLSGNSAAERRIIKWTFCAIALSKLTNIFAFKIIIVFWKLLWLYTHERRLYILKLVFEQYKILNDKLLDINISIKKSQYWKLGKVLAIGENGIISTTQKSAHAH